MTTRTPSTQIRWRVETKAKTGRWIKRGLFETREAAREQARYMRVGRMCMGQLIPGSGYGFGNVRVVRYQPGTGAAK